MIVRKGSEWKKSFCDNGQKYLKEFDDEQLVDLFDIHDAFMKEDSGEVIEAFMFFLKTDGIPKEIHDYAYSAIESLVLSEELAQVWEDIKNNKTNNNWRKLNTAFCFESYEKMKVDVDSIYKKLRKE